MKKTYLTYEDAQRVVKENKIKTALEYNSFYKEYNLPSDPSKSYRGNGWIDWYNFLGVNKKNYPKYKAAKTIVQDNNVKSIEQYKSCYKKLGLPLHPQRHYKDKGWVNWIDFFGKKVITYPSYIEAQEKVKKNDIKSSVEYKSSHKKLGLPLHPQRFYLDKGWVDWYDFLGINKKDYPSYTEAQEINQKNDIKSQADYMKSYKKLKLPVAPHLYYEDDWVDWYDYLGKSRRVSSDERKYRILIKLCINSLILHDDASVQLIYILVSHLDTKWAKEIEEKLLGTTSFEERLNWVKEQLNKLKEGGVSIHKTTFVTPSDELSAMESILEEFEVTDKVNFTLENYLHSAVNRELISEYDG